MTEAPGCPRLEVMGRKIVRVGLVSAFALVLWACGITETSAVETRFDAAAEGGDSGETGVDADGEVAADAKGEADAGTADASCTVVDGGKGAWDFDSGCHCPPVFLDDPSGTPCDVPTDCARCIEGTCWADCVQCGADAATVWKKMCTE